MGKRKNKNKAVKKPPNIELKEEIEREMESSNYTRSYRQAKFVSLDFIADLFKSTNPSKLQLSIQADLEISKSERPEAQIDDVKIEKLVEYVRREAFKLYAVLLLVGQSHLIVQLYNNDYRVTDRIFEKGEDSSDVPYCSLEYLRAMPQLSDVAGEIFEKQWCFPPVLRREFHQKFPIELFRFPFQNVPQKIGEGAWGHVYKVRVAEGHLEVDDKSYINGSVVAYKETKWRKQDMTEEKLMREVDTIRARRHPNIVPFFASFSAGREDPWSAKDRTECLHMLFQHTDAGNMQDWLTQDGPPMPELADVDTRREYIINYIKCLISAVTYIHKEQHGFVAYHHDLKPGNILLFRGPPAVWKICDFGMANLKYHLDNSGTTQGPSNRFGTYDYQPPEYFTDGPGRKHGRSFDVYSLGCIVLELATIWKHGWSEAGIKKFCQLRGENTEHACIDAPGKPKPPYLDYSFHNSPKVVEEWIRHLREGEDVNQDFKDLLDLISEMLVQRAQRIFVWEVDMDLYEMGGQKNITQLRNHLYSVVQPSKTSLNELNNQHNPLKRAIEKKKGWQEDILKHYKWSVRKPQSSKRLGIKPRETGLYYTTLTSCPHTIEFEQNVLFGRHDMDVQITKALHKYSCIGLHGMSGMGKSHLAYHYAVRFRDTDSRDDRKHTFWVEGGTEPRFRETVRRIADEIQLEVPDAESLLDSVKEWLSDTRNGPWIMVIDGLDNNAAAAAVKKFLPRYSGEVIITTKNREILDGLEGFFPNDKKKTYFKVDQLDVSESRLVFQWHNDDVLPDESKMDHLLEQLLSPVIIKLVAKYCSNNNKPTSELYKAMEDRKPLNFPKRVYNDLSERYSVFEPLISSMIECPYPSRFDKWPSPELRLLGELSCLNKDEIDIRLIQRNYGNDDKLWEMMGLLENCSYVGKRTGGDYQCYFMHETVQDLVRQWVLKNMGAASLLELHATALCMLIILYKEEKSKNMDAKKMYRSSYRWKLQFMPHFERFLEFARDASSQLARFTFFECPKGMVYSIVTFSQVYLDEGRFDDAVCVLEFARNLYKGTELRPNLIRLLSKAYILPPLARTCKGRWTTAAKLLKEVISECEDRTKKEQKWRCILDLVHLYSKSIRPEEASMALRCLKEVSLDVKADGFSVKRQCEGVFEQKVERNLAILKQIAQAEVHYARAKGSAISAVKSKELQSAHSAFNHAKNAILSWFPGEDKWVLEVEEGIARVLCEMGDSGSVQKSIQIFQKLLERLEGESPTPKRTWSQKRMWDVKCRIACAQLKLGGGWEKLAIDTLNEVLKLYEECYEKQGGQHNEHTRACAHLIEEAYKDVGKDSKAQEIKERYSLQPVDYAQFPDAVVGSGSSPKGYYSIVVLVILAMVFLCNSYQDVILGVKS